MLMSKTALVTGGGGFIGTHLCQSLLDDDYFVICIDNFYSSSPNNIKELNKNPRFLHRNIDICKLHHSQLTVNIDEIYHLACPASPEKYSLDKLQTLDVCYIGTKNILEIAKESGAKILFTSTSEIYGDPLEHPQRETYYGNVNSIGSRACYDEGKRVAETLVKEFCRKWDLKYTIVRVFNTYGSHLAIGDGRVVSNFIANAIRNRPLKLYNGGTQTRSLCYISDLISALRLGMSSNLSGPLNLGNDQEITIQELAQLVIRLCGSNSVIIDGHDVEGDPQRRKPDISLARALLDWSPQIGLEDGLKLTIDWFRKLIG
jgi:UDP-glucuronate decarboxylase